MLAESQMRRDGVGEEGTLEETLENNGVRKTTDFPTKLGCSASNANRAKVFSGWPLSVDEVNRRIGRDE